MMNEIVLLVYIVNILLSLSFAVNGQSITWQQIGSPNSNNPPFPGRETAGCAFSPLTSKTSSSSKLIFFAGYYITGSTTYSNYFYNDIWHTTDGGSTYSRLDTASSTTGVGSSSNLLAGAFVSGAGILNNGVIIAVPGNGSADSNSVYYSTTANQSPIVFTADPTIPYTQRDNTGYAVLPGTNALLIAYGDTTPDIWLSDDGHGSTWRQVCSQTSSPRCPTDPAALSVHGPAVVGLYGNSIFLIAGGYNNNATNTYSLSNWVSYSTYPSFSSWTTYAANWPSRGQPRITADLDNYIYIQGGVVDLGSRATWTYFSDVWYSSDFTSSAWIQLPSSSSGASIPAVFNGCLGFRYTPDTYAKQLYIVSGVIGGYIQSASTPQFPIAWQGTLSLKSNAGESKFQTSTAMVLFLIISVVLGVNLI